MKSPRDDHSFQPGFLNFCMCILLAGAVKATYRLAKA